MNVTAVRTNDWKKDDGTVTKVTNVTFDDGQEVPGYDLPAEPEVGKPLPDGWEIATSARGKPYIKVPKPRGGGGGAPAAYRNTQAGQAAEQRSIHASVALQHAITLRPNGTNGDILRVADELYAWLQRTSGAAAVPHSDPSPSAAAAPSSPADDEGRGRKKAQNRTSGQGGKASASEPAATGEGGLGSGAVCAHENVTLSKPDGSPLPSGFYRCEDCNSVRRIT